MGIIEAFLSLDYIWIVLIISILATLLTTLIYKYTTKQERLKKLKGEIKELREKMKKHKDNQKKLLEVQGQMMEKNMEIMKSSFKPMLYTFIPLILLFSWLSATIAYEPLMPNEPFTVTAQIAEAYPGSLDGINLSVAPEAQIVRDESYAPEKGKAVRWIVTTPTEGTYSLLFEGQTFKQTKEVLVSTQKKYSQVFTEYKDNQLQKIIVGNKEVKPFEGVPVLQGLNWLWSYIIISILASILLRKALDVV